MCLLTNSESATELKTLSDQLHLVEALLSGVEHHQGTVLGEAVSEGEKHGSLTSTRGTSEEEHLGRGESLTTQGSVEVFETGGNLYAQCLRYLDLEDVGSDFDII